ncbi:hypothetical protein ACET3X_003576 [Alternaria dauci]|uniref:Uncharacterized protein n=1 Tax=Alternaria dauci TaxID=48095 RepID=A0ABR3UT82_9PLEO
MASTIVLITGANRGLGLGLLQRYLAQPNHTVIAGNRNPAHPSSQALAKLPKGEGSKLIVVKIDASVEEDASTAIKELQDHHGIDHLDIVIANAGVAYVFPLVADLKLEDLRGHLGPNVFGFLTLYQATRPLLQKSQKEPIFAPVGSTAGYLVNQLPIQNAAYAPTKAMVHWYTIRINSEDPWLNAFVLDPGWAQTDMGNGAAHLYGLEQAEITVDTSCDGMIKVISESTKEKDGGKMIGWDGGVRGW